MNDSVVRDIEECALRRFVASIVFALLVLVAVPAARAADYPPGSPGSGISSRQAQAGQSLDGLAQTGTDLTHELGIGAGLIVIGGTILLVTRRRRVVRG
jgi:LPXTG-motif cell wall-anchored protein